MNPIKNEALGIGVLGILYAVGIFGIALPLHEKFIFLTPINLLISVALILFFHQAWTSKTIIFLSTCFALGLIIEMLGVQTGMIFGSYQYGPVLGPKIFDTPLMIGVNWAMLSYAAACLVNRITPKLSWWVKALLGATFMLALDFLIEPVAMHYNFWSWEENQVPLQNYIAWWGIALVLQVLFFQIQDKIQNKVAAALFILQVLFFGILNLLI